MEVITKDLSDVVKLAGSTGTNKNIYWQQPDGELADRRRLIAPSADGVM